MIVKGEHQFDVSAQELWNYLMDIDVLAKITPGVSKLELIEEDKYKTVSDIKIGPVKGSFKGDLEVIEKNEPDSFAIKMEQLSKIGNAHVKVDMKINQNEGAGSTLIFDGKAKLSGVIARTGQRVLSGVANKITKEVFASLDEHIAEDQKTNGGAVEKSVEKVEVNPIDKTTGQDNTGETQENEIASTTKEAIEKKQTSVNTEVEKSEVPPLQGRLGGSEETKASSGELETPEKTQTSVNTEVEKSEVPPFQGRLGGSEEPQKQTLETPNNSNGLFSGIINFFKNLFS